MTFTADGKRQRLPLSFYFFLDTSSTVHRKYKHFYSTVQTAEGRQQRFHFCRYRLMYSPTTFNSRDNSTRMTGFSHKTFENSLFEVSENSGSVATTFHNLCENCASILKKLLQTSTKLDTGYYWMLKFSPLWSLMHSVIHDRWKWFWLAHAYTDACHTMRRWKTAVRNLMSGFSLPGISSSYPTSKKSLILRLLFSPRIYGCSGRTGVQHASGWKECLSFLSTRLKLQHLWTCSSQRGKVERGSWKLQDKTKRNLSPCNW